MRTEHDQSGAGEAPATVAEDYLRTHQFLN